MSSFPTPLPFLFFLFFCSLASAACFDSDGGDAPLIAGACSTESFYAQDNCVAEGGLNEYYCSGEYCISSITDCSYGCLMGACRSAPPEPLESCVSSGVGFATSGSVLFQMKAGESFEVLGVEFEVIDWTAGSVWLEDSEGVMVNLVQGEEFDYKAFTMTFTGFDESKEPVQGTIDFIEEASSSEYCIVVWSPRNEYDYAPSEAELSFEVTEGSIQSTGNSDSFVSEAEEIPFSCAYSIDGAPYSNQFSTSVNELVEVNLPQFIVGSHSVTAYCSRGSIELPQTVEFNVLFESLEDVLLVSPANASTQVDPVPLDFWLYGNRASYECEAQVDSGDWLAVSGVGAPGYSYQGSLFDLESGEHSAMVRCKSEASIISDIADDAWFYSNENEFSISGALPFIVSPLNNSNHSAGELNVSYAPNCVDCECALYLNNSLEDERYSCGEVETIEFELGEGNYSAVVSCNESNSTPVVFHVLPEGELFVNVPDVDSPLYGKSYAIDEPVYLVFEVSGSFDEYACYERLDEAENYSFVINTTDSTPILIGDYYQGLDEGAHSMAFECRGLSEGNETEYNASVEILFQVGEEIIIVEEGAGIPPLPSVVPPMPTPQPEQKQDYLQLDCPQASSSSSTKILAVLYVNGRPTCDSNTRVIVNNGEGKGAFVVCDSQSGEHELSISSSKAGQYVVFVESLSYGQVASCSFTRSKGSVQAEEAPDLPIAVAVATALFAFAALKRKQ